jgi:hypothetical protein
MKQLWLVIFACLATYTSTIAQVLPPDAGEINSETQVRLFSPFTPQALNPNLVVNGQISGTCTFTSSIAERPDAWKCQSSDGQAYEPCFQNPFNLGDSVLACTPDPQGGVTLLQVTNALASPETPRSMSERLPWVIELANGLRCFHNPTLNWQIGGLPALYACGDQAYALGMPDKSSAIWRIFYVRFGQSVYLETIGIQIVWY